MTGKSMNSGSFSINWVDFAILLVVMIGVSRGRKRGMSQELFDLIKWCLIVIIAGVAYQPLGRVLNHATSLGLLFSFILTYAGILSIVFVGFSFVRLSYGEKLVGRDFFGDAEYYLGMVAGGFRYACFVIVVMALLNARYYTPQDLAAQEKFQNDNFGSIHFPTMAEAQKEVFDQAITGRTIQSYLHVLLIKPTSPQDDGKNSDQVSPSRRGVKLDDKLEKRR